MNVTRIVSDVKPAEIYNLGAMSHVKVSFEMPEYTANVNAIGPLRILEAMRLLGLNQTRFYQASTSELYGNVTEVPQKETTPFQPRSPYGIAKLHAFWTVVNYREAYGAFACNGILFNHESPLRGETFVSRKICKGVAAIVNGKQNKIFLGNLDAKRDWGHAKDYAKAMWLMLQAETPEDFVVATGRNETVRTLAQMAFREAGVEIRFEGSGAKEKGVVSKVSDNVNTISPGDELISIDPEYFRPAEVDELIGDYSKAKERLNWQPRIALEEMIQEMVQAELAMFTS
jgi:GDPmannose 4,6-dehydratase